MTIVSARNPSTRSPRSPSLSTEITSELSESPSPPPSKDVQRLLKQRYLQPDESWEELASRVTGYVCRDESSEFKSTVYHQILNRVWLPNSPCLASSGTRNGGLLACYVVGPDKDTLEDHVNTLGDIAEVGKRGGGCGFSGTNIRHKGAPVSGSTHGYAYGPNAWAMRVSEYLDMITQGGFRKMALMYTLSSDHPDLNEFIDLKQTQDERFAYNFNQSIFASDAWMQMATLNKDSEFHRQLWQVAVNAWNNGEPGLLFADTINSGPYAEVGERIIASNPCGEQPLPSYGACVLASINVNHSIFYDKGLFDFDRLREVASTATQFLDNVGSINKYPNHKFESWYEDHRPVGLGLMGFADLCLKMGVRYGGKVSNSLLRNIMKVIYTSAKNTSERLGRERGVPDKCESFNRRNITLTTIAPTGSISFLAECSSSIEPIFSPQYTRTDERGEKYIFEHPEKDSEYFVSAINDDKSKVPTWKEHVDIQLSAQKYVDSGVSKTINMKYESTIDEVYEAMVYAWQGGAKGITVYRNGSRQTQVLNDGGDNKKGESVSSSNGTGEKKVVMKGNRVVTESNATEDDRLSQDCPSGVCEI